MAEGDPIINIGELSKPATVLIEKVSDAVGGLLKPWQIRRVAKAEADAEKIKALAEIETDELRRRALVRFVGEETKKQSNMESITGKATCLLNEDAEPQHMDNDWISNFFDNCRLISNEEMQTLWAKVLAGEANSPGKYSKRTVNFLSAIDKADATMFTALCRFVWFIGDYVPLIFNESDDIYQKYGISFNSLMHLDEVGFINFQHITGFKKAGLEKRGIVLYYKKPVCLEFDKERDNELNIGRVILTKVGQELASIAESEPIPEFVNYVVGVWQKKSIVVKVL
ncbi:MAG: DUF2806 domain-containing protein [Desulfobacteraceae bacterium]|nr:DUF2806 domain-containing protein [Desulfobacteraceae bacterium]